MTAEILPPAFTDFEESAELDLPEVLALQSLVMGDVRREAIQLGRRIRTSENPRTHAFAVLMNSGDDTRNGEIDYFFSVRMRKLGTYGCRVWALGVSFLECEQTEETQLENSRTLYQFRWDEHTALGRKLEIRALAHRKIYGVQPNGMPVLPGTTSVHRAVKSPLATDELDDIANRALGIVYAAAPRMHRLIDRFVAENLDAAA